MELFARTHSLEERDKIPLALLEAESIVCKLVHTRVLQGVWDNQAVDFLLSVFSLVVIVFFHFEIVYFSGF